MFAVQGADYLETLISYHPGAVTIRLSQYYRCRIVETSTRRFGERGWGGILNPRRESCTPKLYQIHPKSLSVVHSRYFTHCTRFISPDR